MNDSLFEYETTQSEVLDSHSVSMYDVCQKLMSLEIFSKDDFFTAFNFSNEDIHLGYAAYGSFAEIKVHLSHERIIFSFVKDERSILTEFYEFQSESTPYSLLFICLHDFTKKVKSYLLSQENLPNNKDDIVFFGGWKAITRKSGIMEIARFTLPIITIKREKNKIQAIHYKKKNSNEVNLYQIIEGDKKLPKMKSLVVVSESYASSRQEYEEKLHKIVLQLKNINNSKVVLSKKKDILFETAPEPLAFAAKLASKHGQVYDYIFHWKNDKYWLGVSPEVLLIKNEQCILTKPLAGTIKVEQKTGINKAAKILINDKKESQEHLIASSKLEKELKEICIPGSVKYTSDKDAFVVGYAVHLRSVLRGEVDNSISSFEVLSKIYPPATIWGTPNDWCAAIIKSFENFERGYFTGGFGYFTLEDNCNFSLVIRNASLSDSLLEIYAGSGVIDQSDPKKEWIETETKMTPILSTLQD